MKARIAAALFAVATSSSAEDLKEFKFSAPPPVVQNDTPATCAFKDFKALDAMVVYAQGLIRGVSCRFRLIKAAIRPLSSILRSTVLSNRLR